MLRDEHGMPAHRRLPPIVHGIGGGEPLRDEIAREARNNVIAEIEQDMDVFRRRAEIQPCIDRRLDEIEQLIRAAPSSLPRPLWIGRPQVWELYTQRWNTASVGGRTSLLTLDQ